MVDRVYFGRTARKRIGRYYGQGYLAGTAPFGLATVDGAPRSYWIETRHRETRQPIAYTRSNADGKYMTYDVDPALEYDRIARDLTGTHNDAIVSRQRPEPYDLTTLTDHLVADGLKLTGYIEVYGGLPGHTVAVTAGTAPAGITYGVKIIMGNDGRATFAVVPDAGETTAGTYDWTLTVTAPNGTSKDIELHKVFA